MVLALLACQAVLAAKPVTSLPEHHQSAIQQLAPGIEITPDLVAFMKEVVYSHDHLDLDTRIQAMSRLSGVQDLPEDQRMRWTICIWDPVGRHGPIFSAAKEQQVRAMELGVTLDLVPYTTEGVLADELKSGRCDAALMSGMRARNFNLFTGTIDAIGALPTREHMKTLLHVVAHPHTAPKMVQGPFVVMGVFPGGGAYAFVNDREINTLAKAAGKRVAVLEHDPTQAEMIAGIGATPISTDITRAPGMFNNGVVDVLAAPLMAYQIMELYKGMEPDGGIIDYPLAQITMQLVGDSDTFPNEMAQLIREMTLQHYDRIMEIIAREEAMVPQKWFIPLPEQDKLEYENMMKQARIELRERGYYHSEMLTLQRKIRCKLNPSHAECANPEE
jgi:hypothetical protein